MTSKYTKDDFIKKAKEIHGDKYDYSKVEYVNVKTKVCIICPQHGEFWQTPEKHILRRQGCKKCATINWSHQRIIKYVDFLKRAHDKFGDKFQYDEHTYQNYQDVKMKIICPEHGEFWQTPEQHVNSKWGCPQCGSSNIGKLNKDSQEDFIQKAKNLYGDKYDYSKVEYVNTKTKVCIICPKHGEFWQTPNALLQGHGCHTCHRNHLSEIKRIPYEIFIERAKKIHGEKYEYDKDSYLEIRDWVNIKCPKHGWFKIRAINHILLSRRSGCPKCQRSSLEKEVVQILKNDDIDFQEEYTNEFLGRGKRKLYCDFYLPDHNIVIECQGKQHFEEVIVFGGEEEFIKIQERDKRKYALCKKQGIKVLYYTHEDYDTFLGEELIKEPNKLIEQIFAQ